MHYLSLMGHVAQLLFSHLFFKVQRIHDVMRIAGRPCLDLKCWKDITNMVCLTHHFGLGWRWYINKHSNISLPSLDTRNHSTIADIICKKLTKPAKWCLGFPL